MAKSLLKPAIPKDLDRKLVEQKRKQAFYYNVSSKELPDLKEGDVVRVKPLKATEKGKPWRQARIEGKVDVHSYKIRTEDGRVYRRNRQHLRHSREQPEESTTTSDVEQHTTDVPPEANATSSNTQYPTIRFWR